MFFNCMDVFVSLCGWISLLCMVSQTQFSDDFFGQVVLMWLFGFVGTVGLDVCARFIFGIV